MDYLNNTNSAVYDSSLKSTKYHNQYGGFGYSLKKIINEPTTTINDIAKWQWQLIDLAMYTVSNNVVYNCPMDTNELRISPSGDIVVMPKFEAKYSNINATEIGFGNSLIKSYKSIIMSMLCVCSNKELKLRLSILNVLFDHIVTGSDMANTRDVPHTIRSLVGNLCHLVDTGIVDSIVLVGKEYINKQ